MKMPQDISDLNSFVFMDEMPEFIKDGKIPAVQKYRRISTIVRSIVWRTSRREIRISCTDAKGLRCKEGSVGEFSTDTRLPHQTVHASIRLASLLLRAAPFPPTFLPFFPRANSPVSWLCIIYGPTDPRRTKPILSPRGRTAGSSM